MNNQAPTRVAFIGEASVGKTSIIIRAVNSTFDTVVDSTICASSLEYKMNVDDVVVPLDLWDTAGQERFRSISSIFLRNSQIVVIVCAINDRGSFDQLTSHLKLIKENAPEDVILFLACNKSDLPLEENVIKFNELEEFAHANNIEKYFVTSALNGQNIDQLFVAIARAVISKKSTNSQSQPKSVDLGSEKENKAQCC
ncbi:Ras-related protein Rab-6A [Tritrichomonas foetus]|uniref:Ras-related protein Rab-6A n=1 Tax=Tritrichomonas foetus TaxID=1144522 RepID=A0A1J4JWE0_9EUKA|nr:Ras-related protein Rab-6A [Tritrichomonas foetus]|eukprot:OHT01605.1 Ras-related protein Rab-6A [Tritrichomonas foetus]